VLAGFGLAVAAVAALRLILGPWQAALVVGPAVWVATLVGMAILEHVIFDRPAPVIDVQSRPAGLGPVAAAAEPSPRYYATHTPERPGRPGPGREVSSSARPRAIGAG
jgi:hypothetical protein